MEDFFNFDENDFLDDDIFESSASENRITSPRKHPPTRDIQIKYKNALQLSKEVDFSKCDRYDLIVSGDFIFGDFIESLLVDKNIQASEMVISTLSLSQENVDSLNNLISNNYVLDLSMVVSDYFYSHERGNLIPYMYDVLDHDNKFQLAVCRTHTKICYFKTAGGKKIVIHGSSNLRSSGNIEQFTIEINPNLYDFYDDFFKKIVERYKTINKSISSKDTNQFFKD